MERNRKKQRDQKRVSEEKVGEGMEGMNKMWDDDG